MRQLSTIVVAGLLLAALVVAVLEPGGDSAPQAGSLQELAVELGMADPADFVEVVESVRTTGRLPDRYVDKRQARALGWEPGSDLCDSAPDRVIGGDRFQNREGRLPAAAGRQWFEADLDFDCGRRGAKRLVFSNDGLIFVTTDHYESFVEVPQ
jgi:hypothetical protein